MARSIWKGSISFGLVNIPVGLYSAEKKRDEIHFHLLDQRNLSPIRYKRVSEKTGREVPWEEIVRGYEHADGQYVVLSDEDLKRANPKATQTVDIVEFVDGAEISQLFYDRPYYLAPQKQGGMSYALLRETLARSGKVGIAKVVIRTRQYLAAVIPREKVLVLELLRYAHELREIDDLELPGSQEVSAKEIHMAERLVESMVDRWDPEKYRDDYREDLMTLIERRVETGETAEVEAPAPEPREGAKVIDLMSLLKQSVEGTSGKGRPKRRTAGPPTGKPAKRPAAREARPAARKPARKPAAAARRSSSRKSA